MHPIRLLLCILLLLVPLAALAEELPADPGVVERITDLNARVISLMEQGHLEEALAPARESFDLYVQVAGQDSLELAQAMNNLAWLCNAAGHPEEARPLYEQALSIVEWKAGPEHVDAAFLLHALAGVQESLGDLETARQYLERALAIREKIFGPEHELVARTANDLGWVYDGLFLHEQSIAQWQKALAIWDSGVPVDPLTRASTLNNIGFGLAELGRHEEAVATYQRALEEYAQMSGKDHPDTVNVMNNLARSLAELGRFDEAETLFADSLSLLEASGAGRSDLAAALMNNYADLLSARARYLEAQNMMRQGLALREELHGPESPEVGLALNNLASLHGSMGQHDLARSEFEQALDILTGSLGEEHPLVAGALSAFGATLNALGDYDRAEEALRRSLDLHTRIYGLSSPVAMAPMNNLALTHLARSEKEEARVILELGRAILEDNGLEEDASYASLLNSLSGVLHEMGRLDEALDYASRSLALRERILGMEHPDTAVSLHNKAAILDSMGRSAEALELFLRSNGIMLHSLGDTHPNVAHSFNNIGRIQARLGEREQGLASLTRGQEVLDRTVRHILAMSSERERLLYLGRVQESLHVYLSLVLAMADEAEPAGRDAMVAGAWSHWLKRKGLALEAGISQTAWLSGLDDPQVQARGRELAEVRAVLSGLHLSPPADLGPEDWKIARDELVARKNELEAQLSRLGRDMGRQEQELAIGPEEVLAALPPDSLLLDLARITPYDFNVLPDASSDAPRWLPERYLAFVALPGDDPAGRVFLVDLGEAAGLDGAIMAYRQAILDEEGEAELAESLFDRLLAPVDRLLVEATGRGLEAVDSLFISQDGQLNLLPFEALKRPSGPWLAEDMRCVYLACARDVAERAGDGLMRPSSGPSLLLGDPDFGPGNNGSGPFFPPLPGARQEVEAVAAIMDKAGRSDSGQLEHRVVLGAEGTEPLLRSISHPRILHLATHGFFLTREQAEQLRQRSRAFLIVPEVPAGMDVESAGTALFRSGLALSGANQAFSGQGEPEADGLFTAEDFLGLDLRGTELVVLSACKTGLGETHDGEGVFGLRRGVALSGADGLVMSLWSVPDEETRELMQAFYSNLLLEGQDRATALNRAIRSQIQVTRERYAEDHPYYWAPFVFMGRP